MNARELVRSAPVQEALCQLGAEAGARLYVVFGLQNHMSQLPVGGRYLRDEVTRAGLIEDHWDVFCEFVRTTPEAWPVQEALEQVGVDLRSPRTPSPARGRARAIFDAASLSIDSSTGLFLADHFRMRDACDVERMGAGGELAALVLYQHGCFDPEQSDRLHIVCELVDRHGGDARRVRAAMRA